VELRSVITVRLSFAEAGAALVAFALLTIVGCSSQPAETTAQEKAGDYVEMNFDLDKCLPVEPNLYKCPAIDKPLCTPQFARTDVECVHIGPKGAVYMQKTGMF
jgi:hypothetical protein